MRGCGALRETCERLRDCELAVIERPADTGSCQPGGSHRAQIVERADAARDDDLDAVRGEGLRTLDVGPLGHTVACDLVVTHRPNTELAEAPGQLLRRDLGHCLACAARSEDHTSQ